MAAATVDSSKIKLSVPFVVHEWQLSALTSDQQEALTHTMTSQRPDRVDCFIVTPATDHSSLTMDWLRASDNTTNNTVTVRFKTDAGGDLTGAVVRVWAYFFDAASGGTSPT